MKGQKCTASPTPEIIEGNALSYFCKFIPLTAIYNYTFGFIHCKNKHLMDSNAPVINSSELVSKKSIKDPKRQQTNGKELIVRSGR